MAAAGLILFSLQVAGQVPVATQIAILKAEDARDHDGLKPYIFSKNLAVQKRALLAAGRIGAGESVDALAGILENGDESVRAMAAFALGETEQDHAAPFVIRAMQNVKASPEVRARAVEAAGKIAAANREGIQSKLIGPAIVSVLKHESEKRSGPYTELIRAAVTAVLRARPEGGAEAVAAFLGYSDQELIADALNTLARLRYKGANDKARELLTKSTDPIVRANAARLLGAAEDTGAVEILIAAATKDADSRVRVSAIRSLGALKAVGAADALIKRGGVLMQAYSKSARPNFIPNEHSEFVEIATALGQIIPNTYNDAAANLFREFGTIDNGFTPEVYIARLRVAPGPGSNIQPALTSWKQYRTLALIGGEWASLEVSREDAVKMKSEAPDVLRTLAKAYAEADPAKEAGTILAAPDVLRSFARFKTDDLGAVLRTALQNKDVHIRATAAELIADLPASKENADAVKLAFGRALVDDKKENDAALALLSAAVKLDKAASFDVLRLALGSSDHLVRKRAYELIAANKLDEEFENAWKRVEPLKSVNPRGGSKLGVVVNNDAEYRRAAMRKNGSVRAVFTTAKGNFTIDLLPEDAPLTVDNFIKLANAKYFDGLEVHRVVPNFVMQDGDPIGNGSGGPGWTIRCEINMVPYTRGAVGMALSGKDTGGSQWFVTHSPQPHLDGGYTVFGRVNETGMKVVDNIVRGDKIVTVRIVGR